MNTKDVYKQVLSVLILFSPLCGCYSSNIKSFSGSEPQLHKSYDLSSEVQLRGKFSSRHVPFIYWKVKKTSPFTPVLRVRIEDDFSEKLYIEKASISTNDGQSFTLEGLGEIRNSLNFRKKAIYKSGQSGRTTRYVLEAEHIFSSVPMKFHEGMECHIFITLRKEPSGASFILKRKLIGKQLRKNGSILKAYADI